MIGKGLDCPLFISMARGLVMRTSWIPSSPGPGRHGGCVDFAGAENKKEGISLLSCDLWWVY